MILVPPGLCELAGQVCLHGYQWMSAVELSALVAGMLGWTGLGADLQGLRSAAGSSVEKGSADFDLDSEPSDLETADLVPTGQAVDYTGAGTHVD